MEIDLIKTATGYNLESELKKLKITKIIPIGEKGYEKGWRGYVFKAKISEQIVALKIGDPTRIQKETKNLKLANTVNVGPQFLNNTEHIVAMQFLDGKPYPKWLDTATNESIKNTILNLLDQAQELDSINLDHGQLSNAEKHVIICEKPYLIDFEKGSTERTARNLSSILNFLLLNPYSAITRKTREKLNIDTDEIKRYAAEYNRKQGEAKTSAFERIRSRIAKAG